MLVEARGINAGYQGRTVLHEISLHLAAGELLGLLGPNGCGKSTLLRALSGVISLTGGTVTISGTLLSALTRAEVARGMAFVPQQEPALFDFTVADVVLMGRYARSQGRSSPTGQDYAAAAAAMESADVVALAGRSISSLSGGEHRRVLLARALAQEAPILLLDEPTAHLDPGHQIDLMARIRALTRRPGCGAIMALHDVSQADYYCDRVILLSSGRVRAQGTPVDALTPSTLLEIYNTPFEAVISPATGARHLMPVNRTMPCPSHQENLQ